MGDGHPSMPSIILLGQYNTHSGIQNKPLFSLWLAEPVFTRILLLDITYLRVADAGSCSVSFLFLINFIETLGFRLKCKHTHILLRIPMISGYVRLSVYAKGDLHIYKGLDISVKHCNYLP